MKASSVLNLTPSTKTQVAEFVQKVIAEVEAGVCNPLQLSIQMKAMEDACKTIKDAIKKHAMDEAYKYGDKSFEAFSADLNIVEAGVRYDFEPCDDKQWNDVTNQMLELRKKQLERETFLKGVRHSMTIVDEPTGEIYTINPPVKHGTTTLKITLK